MMVEFDTEGNMTRFDGTDAEYRQINNLLKAGDVSVEKIEIKKARD